MIKSSPRLSGALAPVLTPFNRDGSPSAKRFIAHARHLLNQDVGLALFGTNSEFASLTLGERRTLFDALLTAIAPTNKMMVGVGACAHGDVVEMTKAALEGGCPNVLMLPPFYFKGVSEEGIFRSVSNVIESVGDSNLRIYLYHIPSVTQVPFNMTVIERLLDSYPGIIAGIKDTSGDISHSLQLIERFGPRGFDVFAGSEINTVDVMQAGGSGVISATANVNGAEIAKLCRDWDSPEANEKQAKINRIRAAFGRFAMIPAMKTAVAARLEDDEWLRVRAPLVALDIKQRTELLESLAAVGFEATKQAAINVD